MPGTKLWPFDDDTAAQYLLEIEFIILQETVSGNEEEGMGTTGSGTAPRPCPPPPPQDCSTLVFNAYRPLSEYADTFARNQGLPTDKAKEQTQAAWTVVNDSLRTSVPLLFPPHMIALGVWRIWGCWWPGPGSLPFAPTSRAAHGRAHVQD